MKKGQKMSAEVKKRISEKLKGHPSFMNGYKHPEIIKKQISESKKGKHTSPKTEFKKGHTFSDETRKKISESRKGKRCGPTNNRWKGGEYKTTSGYMMVLYPTHPFCNNQGYVRKHRLIMEQHLGRFLIPIEVVHHKNGNTLNNRLCNLHLFPNGSEHSKLPKRFKYPRKGTKSQIPLSR